MHTNPYIYTYLLVLIYPSDSIWNQTWVYTDISNSSAALHSSFHPFSLACLQTSTPTVENWLPPSAIHLFTYTVVSEWLTGTTPTPQLIQPEFGAFDIPFAFSLRITWVSTASLTPFSEVISYVSIQLILMLQSAFHTGISRLSKCFLFFFSNFIGWGSLCCKVLWVLTNALCPASTITASHGIVLHPRKSLYANEGIFKFESAAGWKK